MATAGTHPGPRARRGLGSAILTSLALMALGTATASAQTPATIGAIAPPTPIAVYQSTVLWSQPDGNGAYRLVRQAYGGQPQILPVATRKVPFDADLGPTSSGGLYAVYSRCQVEPQWDGTGMPAYETGKGCDVYKLDLGTLTEVRYTKVNASNGSEYWPSYWKGTIAFARAYDSNPGAPYLYSKVIASGAPSQRQPMGSRGTGSSTPLQIELYGSRLGFGWRYQTAPAPRAPAYDLRVDTIGAGHIRLDSVTPTGTSETLLGWPSFAGGYVYWLRSCGGDPGGCQQRGFYASPYTGTPPAPLKATSPSYVLAAEHDQGSITWSETDLSGTSAYACQADPPTTPQCALQPLNASYSTPGGS